MRRHLHSEAFCLMTYQSDQGDRVRIWNSRDGVSPFIIILGYTPYKHVDWDQDEYRPDFVPPIGSLIFVDSTAENIAIVTEQYFDEHWDDPKDPWIPTHARAMGREGAMAEYARLLAASGRSEAEPIRLRVTEEIRGRFERKVSA